MEKREAGAGVGETVGETVKREKGPGAAGLGGAAGAAGAGSRTGVSRKPSSQGSAPPAKRPLSLTSLPVTSQTSPRHNTSPTRDVAGPAYYTTPSP